ncbi:Protein Aster-C [Tritrichomonas musculus]|uniref:Protein Aster-C n=1 Tax=Tritrichomonas musculus TaxID=1915356 RepID=A0ABR2GK24_9EUKA
MQLNLRVLSCKNIPRPEEIIAIDPYIEFRINSNQIVQRTRVIDDTFEPDWKQDFQIPMNSNEFSFVIDISLRSRDVFKEDFEIGSITVIVEDLKLYEVRNESYKLNIVDIDKEKKEAASSSKQICPEHLYTPRFLPNQPSNQKDVGNEDNNVGDSNENGTIVTMMFQIAPKYHIPFEKEGTPQRYPESQRISIANGSFRKGSGPLFPQSLGPPYFPRVLSDKFPYPHRGADRSSFYPLKFPGSFENSQFNGRQLGKRYESDRNILYSDQLSRGSNIFRLRRSALGNDETKATTLDNTANSSWDLPASSIGSKPGEPNYYQYGIGAFPRRTKNRRRTTTNELPTSTTTTNDAPQRNSFKLPNDDFTFFSPSTSISPSKKPVSRLNFPDHQSPQTSSASSYLYKSYLPSSIPPSTTNATTSTASFSNYLKGYQVKPLNASNGISSNRSAPKPFDIVQITSKSNNFSDFSSIPNVIDKSSNSFASRSKDTSFLPGAKNVSNFGYQNTNFSKNKKVNDKGSNPLYADLPGSTEVAPTGQTQKEKNSNFAFNANMNSANSDDYFYQSIDDDILNDIHFHSLDGNFDNEEEEEDSLNIYRSSHKYTNSESSNDDDDDDDSLSDDEDEDEYSMSDTDDAADHSSQQSQTNRNTNFFNYQTLSQSLRNRQRNSSTALSNEYQLNYTSPVIPSDNNDLTDTDDVVEIPNFNDDQPKTSKKENYQNFTAPPTQQPPKTVSPNAVSSSLPQTKQEYPTPNKNETSTENGKKEPDNHKDIRFFFSHSEKSSPPICDIKFVYNPKKSQPKKDNRRKKNEPDENFNESSGPMIYHYSSHKRANSKKKRNYVDPPD